MKQTIISLFECIYDGIVEEVLPIGIVIGIVIALASGAIYGLAWLCEDSPAQTKTKYSAWCKATGVTNLTVQEWKVLYNAEILPGQSKRDRSGEAMAVGIAVGSSINSGK